MFGGRQRCRLETLTGTLWMASWFYELLGKTPLWLRDRKKAEMEKDAEGGSLNLHTEDQKLSSPPSISFPYLIFSSWELQFFFLKLEIRLKIEIAQKRKLLYSQNCIKLHLFKDLVQKEREKGDEKETNIALFGKPRRWEMSSEKEKNFTVKVTRNPSFFLFLYFST